jgi:hypothetical protein
MTFSTDTVNVGLWKNTCKEEKLMNDVVIDNHHINDSRLALFFINWFLLKEDFDGSIIYTYDIIKDEISDPNRKIVEIRKELRE